MLQARILHVPDPCQKQISTKHYSVVLCSTPPKGHPIQDGDTFLSVEESAHFQQLHSPARKSSYWIGRFIAKEAVSLCFPQVERKKIRILNSDLPMDRGQPWVFFPDKSDSVGYLSISHSSDFAAACFHPTHPVGVDLEIALTRDDSFLELNFTMGERSLVEALPRELQAECTTLLWTAKEAMSKVLGKGLSLPTLSMESDLETERVLKFLNKEVSVLHFAGRVWLGQEPLLFSMTSRILEGVSQKRSFLTLAFSYGIEIRKDLRGYVYEL